MSILTLGMDKVIKNLRAGKISAWYQLACVVIFLAIGVLVAWALLFLQNNYPQKYTQALLLLNPRVLLSLMLVGVATVLTSFAVNYRGDNRDFILRFFVLEFAVFWRFALLTFVFQLAYVLLSAALGTPVTLFKSISAETYIVGRQALKGILEVLAFSKVASVKKA